jgi:hypothetical protein
MEQLATRHGLVPELDEVGATACGGSCDLDDALGRRVRRYDVQPSGG